MGFLGSNKRFVPVAILALLALGPIYGLAQDAVPAGGPVAPETVEEGVGTVVSLFEAAKDHKWGMAVGFFLMLVLWAWNKLGKLKISTKYMPLAAAFAGIVAEMGALLIAGGSIMDALWKGLFVGVAASGFWSLVGKHFLTPKKAPEAPPPAPANG